MGQRGFGGGNPITLTRTLTVSAVSSTRKLALPNRSKGLAAGTVSAMASPFGTASLAQLDGLQSHRLDTPEGREIVVDLVICFVRMPT